MRAGPPSDGAFPTGLDLARDDLRDMQEPAVLLGKFRRLEEELEGVRAGYVELREVVRALAHGHSIPVSERWP